MIVVVIVEVIVVVDGPFRCGMLPRVPLWIETYSSTEYPIGDDRLITPHGPGLVDC